MKLLIPDGVGNDIIYKTTQIMLVVLYVRIS